MYGARLIPGDSQGGASSPGICVSVVVFFLSHEFDLENELTIAALAPLSF